MYDPAGTDGTFCSMKEAPPAGDVHDYLYIHMHMVILI